VTLLRRRQLLVVTSGSCMVVVVVVGHLPAAAWRSLSLTAATTAAATRDTVPPVSNALRLARRLVCCQVIGAVCAHRAGWVDGDVGEAWWEPVRANTNCVSLACSQPAVVPGAVGTRTFCCVPGLVGSSG
jgi:hypothetical protein